MFPSCQFRHMFLGKNDPVCIIRAQSGLPAVGEILEMEYTTMPLIMGRLRDYLRSVGVNPREDFATLLDGCWHSNWPFPGNEVLKCLTAC